MADLKITQLTENTSPQTSDILPMVDDPGGTPVTKKITIENLNKVLGGGTSNVLKNGNFINNSTNGFEIGRASCRERV